MLSQLETALNSITPSGMRISKVVLPFSFYAECLLEEGQLIRNKSVMESFERSMSLSHFNRIPIFWYEKIAKPQVRFVYAT